MSTLFIGGDPSSGQNSIVLTRCNILNYQREPIFHGPDYIYTRHALRIRALFNPGVNAWALSPQFTSYAAPSAIIQGMGYNVSIVQRDTGPVTLVARTMGNNNVPGATLPYESAGSVAPVTDVAIRHWLSRPRQQIVLIVGGVPLLVSPNLVSNNNATRPGMDVKGGPFLTANDVAHISGGKSFLVDLSIETFINEFGIFGVSPNLLLSHRWSVSEDIDQDYYSVRMIRGQAHFRRDRLNFLGSAADEFRSYLVHPLPGPGWKRVAAHFEPADDDTSFSYTLIDKELALSVVQAGVTRIEASQRVDVDSGDKWLAGKLILRGAAEVAVAVGAGIGARDIFNGALRLIPKGHLTINVQVWGRSDVNRKLLEDTAIKLIDVRLTRAQRAAALPDEVLDTGKTNLSLTHKLNGTYVEAVCTREYPLPPVGLKDLGLIFPNARDYFPLDDETDGVLTIFHGNVPESQRGLPYYPNSNGTGSRGTTLMKLATSALLTADATPTYPIPANGVPGNLTPS